MTTISNAADAPSPAEGFDLKGVPSKLLAGYMAVLLACAQNQEAIQDNIIAQTSLATSVLDKQHTKAKEHIAKMELSIKEIQYALDHYTDHWVSDAIAKANAELNKENTAYNQDNTFYSGINQSINQNASDGTQAVSLNYEMMKEGGLSTVRTLNNLIKG